MAEISKKYKNVLFDMEIILAEQCESLTGTLGPRYGYAICRRGERFFSQRSPKGPRMRDGHLQFILTCAEMAEHQWPIADIVVKGAELLEAAREAGETMDTILPDEEYHAQQVRELKS